MSDMGDAPGSRDEVLGRAEASLTRGDVEGALRELGTAMDDIVVRRTAMRIMIATGDETTIGLAEDEVALHPDDPEAWALRACATLSTGDTVGYIESWRRAYDLAPESFDVVIGLAVAEEEGGDPGRAIDLYLEALSLRQDDVSTMFRLAQALECSGDVEDALSMYERIIAIEPYNGPVLNCLCNIYGSVLGDTVRTREYCERCLSVFPDDPYSLAVREWLDQRASDGTR